MTAKETARTALASLDLSKLVETEADRIAGEVGEVFAEVASAKERLPLLAPVLAWLARATDAAAKDADTAQRALEAGGDLCGQPHRALHGLWAFDEKVDIATL